MRWFPFSSLDFRSINCWFISVSLLSLVSISFVYVAASCLVIVSISFLSLSSLHVAFSVYCFNFGKENSACSANFFASGGSFPLATIGSSPRKQRCNGIRLQIPPTAEGLNKIILSKMPWANFRPFLYLKIHSLVSFSSVNPFFSSKRIIWKLEGRNFFPIFVRITFLCTFRNAAARRHFSHDRRLLSDKFPFIADSEGLPNFSFFTSRKQKQFDKPNKFGSHLHVFPHDRSRR